MFDDQLKSLTARHKDCRTEMHGTGKMIYYVADGSLVHRVLRRIGEYHEIYTPETNAIALRIAGSL